MQGGKPLGGGTQLDARHRAGAAQQPRWEASVLGLSKRELLEDVLHEMSRDRNLQRLVAQYRDALQDMEELAGGRG